MPAEESLSVQLYSLRLMPSLDEQLRLVRSCGLSFVEANSACLDDAAGFRRLLDRHGLTAPGGHIGIDTLRDSPARAADLCATIGINLLTLWGFPDAQELLTEEQWANAGEELGVLAESLAGNGITFAFHNHDWELADFGKGRIALDVLFEAARGSPLRWQADLAWLARGHANVGAITKRHRDLICACHIKDIAPGPRNAPEGGWADLGQGVLPWHDWWPKMKAYGARWMVLEHDAPSDPQRFLTRSAAAARAIDAETAS